MTKINEEKQFMTIARWLKQADHTEEINLRFRDESPTYEISLKKSQRIRAHHPRLLSTNAAFIMYEWERDDTGENLTKKKIEAAQRRADQLNQEREEFFNQLFTESYLTNEAYETIEEFLSEETQTSNDEINLTEQDRQEATQILKETL